MTKVVAVFVALLITIVAIAGSYGLDLLCPINQYFTNCTSQCPATCDNPTPNPCIQDCGPPGCACQRGFVRKGDNCVRLRTCLPSSSTPQCRANQAFADCPSACPPTCAIPKPRICTLQCLQRSCVCQEGFVRNGNNCVHVDQCST